MIGKLVYATLLLVGPVALAQQALTTGMWQSFTRTDALSGKTITGITLVPSTDTDNEYTNSGFVIRCNQQGVLDLQIDWDKAVTNDSSADTFEIDYRIGQNAVQSGNWDLSNDAEGFFYPANVLAFIQQVEQSSVFVAQVEPLGMEPITATYDTTGLQAAVLPVLKACGFSQP